MPFSRPVLAAVLALIATTTSGCKYILVPTYTVVPDITMDFPSESLRQVFNDKSQILGEIMSDEGEPEAVYWQNGIFHAVPDFLGYSPGIVGLAPSGGVLLNYEVETENEIAVVPGIYDDGLLSILPLPQVENGEHYYYVLARSPAGVNVGFDVEVFETNSSTRRIIVWNGEGDYFHLNVPNVEPTRHPLRRSVYVNDNGTVVAGTPGDNIYMWRRGEVEPELVVPELNRGLAATTGLSKNDIACGLAKIDGRFRAWVYDGSLHYLGQDLGERSASVAYGINDRGHVVGIVGNRDAETLHLVRWQKISKKGDYVAVNISDITNVEVEPGLLSINNSGEILIWYVPEQVNTRESRFSLMRPKGVTLYDTTVSLSQLPPLKRYHAEGGADATDWIEASAWTSF